MNDLVYDTLNIFGIKIKFLNMKKSIKSLRDRIYKDEYDSQMKFIYSNDEKMSYSDKMNYLSRMFYEETGYFPNLKNPRTFNEKINWMKLNYHNPIETDIIDKYKFKNYIKEKLGDGYTVPLIAVYDNVHDIDFDKLPNKFVIKIASSGGAAGVFIVKDKNKTDLDNLKYKICGFMQTWRKCYYTRLLRGHKDIKQSIIIEKYIEQLDGKLYDYKFHCFHGEPKIVLGVSEREDENYKISFMSPEWKPLKLHRGKKSQVAILKKPKNYEKMLELAKILSKDFPFVRVDMYDLGDKVYIGELTFTPKAGFGKYDPIEWDYKMGDWLDLNKLPEEYVNMPSKI